MNDLSIYDSVRDFMRPGDMIAFSGRGFVSNSIRFLTGSPVSHVGAIFERQDGAGRRVILAESTSLDGRSGVQFNPLSARLEEYPGSAWWLPLKEQVRTAADFSAMRAFLESTAGQPYDFRGIAAFLARPVPGLGLLLHHGAVRAWFCSELITAGYEKAGILHGLEPDHIAPKGLCRCSIFEKLVQLIGPPRLIPGFNEL